MFLEVFLDPFVWFCISCITLPLIVGNDNLTSSDVIGYLTEPAMLFSAALLCAAVVETKIACRRYHSPPLPTFYERMRARWYLLNGVVVHILLDGLTGAFKASTLLSKSYTKLDRRFGAEWGSLEGSTVHVVSVVELCVMGPACILLYRAYKTRSAHRDALEFFSCVVQVYGTVVYVGQEVITGMRNFDLDYKMELTPHYLLYFWFAIVLGCLLYLIIPCWWGWESYKRLVTASSRMPYVRKQAYVKPMNSSPSPRRAKRNKRKSE